MSRSGDGNAKSVAVLSDTGAAQSLMLSDVISESADCEVNAKALMQGEDRGDVFMPLVSANLKADVVTGVVKVGVVTSLSLQAVDFLLGNDLAGDTVHVSPLLVAPWLVKRLKL